MIRIETKPIYNIWRKNWRVEIIRNLIIPKIEKLISLRNLIDPQDLEHQVLFRITTYPFKEAIQRINEIIQEQLRVSLERNKIAKIKPKELFQFGFKRNAKEWFLKWGNQRKQLYAVSNSIKRKVYFKELTKNSDINTANDIIQNYHYIHCHRATNGIIIGAYIDTNPLPFAVEELENCETEARNYKKAVLLLHGIDYKRTAEITRCYFIPNSPKNLMSAMDKFLIKLLRNKGYEYVITASMPVFSKTKATTISGGINQPIYEKDIKFEFDAETKQLSASRHKERNGFKNTINSVWKMGKVVEFAKKLNGEFTSQYIYSITKQ